MAIKQRAPKPGTLKPSPKPDAGKADVAFDLWLKRGLHQIYDGVAREPIPEELLRLIQADKDKS